MVSEGFLVVDHILGLRSHLEQAGYEAGKAGILQDGWVFKSGYLELMYLERGRGVLFRCACPHGASNT